ncbi:MAG: hypothetical protein ACXWP4_04375, partial [Polyangiales bacterium]
ACSSSGPVETPVDSGTDAAEAGPSCGNGRVEPPEACDDGAANGTRSHCKADCSGMPAKVSISGDVFSLMEEVSGARVAGAKISVLEQPDKTATTGADAHFQIDGLEEGTDVTLVMDHPDYYPLQSATYKLGPHGIHPFTLQAIGKGLFDVLATGFPPLEQESHCILTTTVSRLGGTLHVMLRQGEAGATVTVSPALPSDSGPIYFNEAVVPDPTLKATTKDGGMLYFHVPPGDYVLSATKPGFAFEPVRMKCRAGYVVNAGPPIGLQANVSHPDWGGASADDTYTAATDGLCEATAKCVEASSPGHYPAATIDSCKSTFRRALSFVDPACDATAHMRDAWKASFTCRSASCTLTLGDDTACAAEEKAMVDAMAAYAPCYSAKHPE